MQLTRAGFLVLLWLFVLAALRVVRSDLYAASGLRASGLPGFRRSDKSARGSKAPRTLVVTHGALTGTRISLDGRPILIGRADDSTLVLDDDFASTRHARLSMRGTDWYVEDLGSTNGTYVEDQRIAQVTPLGPGTRVRIGQSVVELQR
jgi:pSer/pThr/pTyr-binding forkhead associated (FHA) protein